MIGMHPGEYMSVVFVEDMGLSQRAIADKLGMSPSTISRILSTKAPVTADTAIRMENAFGRSAESWMNMQTAYDLKIAREVK